MPEPQTQMISRADLAGRLKTAYPQLDKYSDESIVEAFLSKNPGFASRVQSQPLLPADVQVKPPATWQERWKMRGREAAEVLPAAGAVLGTALAPEGAPIWQLLAAAGLGGMGGEAARMSAASELGEQIPTTLKEYLEQLGKSGGEQVLMEATGRAGESGLGKVFGQAPRVLRPEDQAIKDISEKYGMNLTPAEISRYGLRESLQESAEGSILGRSTMQTAKQQTYQSASKAVDDAVAQLSAPTSSLRAGKSLQNALQDANGIFKAQGDVLYKGLDQKAQGVLVNMSSVRLRAQQILAQQSQLSNVIQKTGAATSAEKKILFDATKLPDYLPFSVANQWRSRLLEITPQSTEMMPTRGPAMAKYFVGQITDAMEQAGSTLKGADAVQAWQTARQYWKDGADIFRDGVVQKLLDKQPSEVVAAVKTPEDVQAVKDALFRYSQKYGTGRQKYVAQASWNRFRERWVRDNLLGAESGQIGVEPLSKISKSLRDIPPETMKAMFSDKAGVDTYTTLREIGQAMDRVDKMPNPPKLGWFRLLHLAGIEEYEWMLAKALTNPRASRYVLAAVRQIPRSIDTAAKLMDQASKQVGGGSNGTQEKSQ
jgi:hypothetical protein